MEHPKIYTRQDIDELKEWFNEHKEEIPESLVVNRYMKYPHLRQTVEYLLEVADEHWEHKYFAGYIIRLEEIRKKMMGEEVD